MKTSSMNIQLSITLIGALIMSTGNTNWTEFYKETRPLLSNNEMYSFINT